jgi:hypothetical protein
VSENGGYPQITQIIPNMFFFQCANGKLMINHGGLGASFSTETIPATEVGR